jgi:hypothetical protein
MKATTSEIATNKCLKKTSHLPYLGDAIELDGPTERAEICALTLHPNLLVMIRLFPLSLWAALFTGLPALLALPLASVPDAGSGVVLAVLGHGYVMTATPITLSQKPLADRQLCNWEDAGCSLPESPVPAPAAVPSPPPAHQAHTAKKLPAVGAVSHAEFRYGDAGEG